MDEWRKFILEKRSEKFYIGGDEVVESIQNNNPAITYICASGWHSRDEFN